MPQQALVNAMRAALRQAGLTAADIGHINAHGLGCTEQDQAEANAIREVFGDRASQVPVTAFKGYYGNAGASSGSLDLAATFMGLDEGVLYPVLGCDSPDPKCGLNIVCGWNPEEFELFGLEMIGDRYAQGLEWFEIMERIHAGAGPFDFEGQFYQLKNVSGRPTPVQRPRPVTLNAAFSPPGRDFAARAADFLFTTFTNIDKGRAQIDDMTARAQAAGRDVGVYTTCHVVCRPSADEAEAYYEHYAVAMEDSASVDRYMKAKQTFSGSHDEEAYRLHRKRFAGGAGTYPLVGTPEHIASEMVRMAEAGFAGTTVSFVNFKDELPYFIDKVLPLLRDAGLRH